MLKISQKRLDGRKNSKQVRNLWNRYWAIYKLVCRRQEHTGGGDGDDETDLEGGSDQANDEDDDKKRKHKPTKHPPVRFSKRVLDSFENSVYFPIIDRV